MTHELLDAALLYVTKGYKVFPCIPKGKSPLTKHGYKDASSDRGTIKQWWTEWPDANIGIPTGAVNGFIVIDIDGDVPEGMAFLNTLSHTVKTKRGFHYYMAYPVEGKVPSRGKIGGYEIDVQSDGKYIIVPPSVHKSGVKYEFLS